MLLFLKTKVKKNIISKKKEENKTALLLDGKMIFGDYFFLRVIFPLKVESLTKAPP